MKKSLKYVNSVFEKYAINNPEIAMYRSVLDEEKSNSDDLKYPLMTSIYSGDVSFKRGEAIMTVVMTFYDRCLADKSNFIEILSDTMFMANDFYAEFYANEAKHSFFFEQSSITISPSIAIYDDSVAGYEMVMNVKIRDFRNELQIPTAIDEK